MGVRIKPTLTLMLGGTSLTAGRLCTPPFPWTYYLLQDMMAAPECQGPVRIINTGKGSQTSNFGASQAAIMAPLRPTHVLMEDFGINDCAIGPVSIPQATINFNSMVNSYRLANPDVIIAHQTMSPASAGDVSRTNLATYYDNGLANAALNDLESLDNYYGTLLVPGGWPKPLPVNLTVPTPTPVGFTAWTGTWNPADKNAAITLSNSNLTATSAGANAAVRGTITRNNNSGKFFYVITVNASTACAMGAMSAANSLSAIVGSGADSVGYRSDGNVYVGGALAATYASYTTGDVIMMALDAVAHYVWFAKNGVWQAGDPEAGTGGIVAPVTNYLAAVSGNSGAVMTADFAGTPGDGLHPIWPDAFEIYSYPNILAWARRMMADFW